jgi:hypothetical protein
MTSLRVVVKIPPSIYPELVADLVGVPLRDRAERLRVLALLGLRESAGRKHARDYSSDGDNSIPHDQERANRKSPAEKLVRRLVDTL